MVKRKRGNTPRLLGPQATNLLKCLMKPVFIGLIAILLMYLISGQEGTALKIFAGLAQMALAVILLFWLGNGSDENSNES